MFSLKFIIGFFAFIVLAHFLSIIYSWYWTYKWIDVPMHFLGGSWLGLIFLYFINPSLEIKNNKKFLTEMLLVVGFVIFIGVLWEFLEFLSDIVFYSKGFFEISQQGTADTMADLFFDLLGGLVAFTAYRFQISKNNTTLTR